MVTRPGNRVARISPLIPGVDLVGTVTGQRPTHRSTVGQQVIAHGYDLGVAHHGGFAQVARVPAGWVVPLPGGLTARQAAAIGTAGFTAALSLHRLEHHGLTARRRPGAGHRRLGRGGQHGGVPAGRPGLRGGGQHRAKRRSAPT